jgi:RNA polymerase sigma-70 factor (ECF subfamily)
MNEKEYLQRAKEGDRFSINYLLNKYRQLSFALALKIINDECKAEDIVQEAFIKVFLNIKNFKTEAKFSTWLFKIICNEAFTYYRKNANSFNSDEDLEYLPQNETNSNQKDQAKLIQESMKCLSRNEYVVIQLFYLADKGIEDIKIITGLSVANIKVLLHRSREKLGNYFSNVLKLKLNDLI